VLLSIQVGYVLHRKAEADRPRDFLIGDCLFYEVTGQSLWEDGDLLVLNQLVTESRSLDRLTSSAQLALSAEGKAVPKHPIIMPILSLPAYAAWGIQGLLGFNVLALLSALLGVAWLGGGRTGGACAALLLLVTTPLLNYSYNYSPDVLALALLVWACVAASGRQLLIGGLLAGLSIWAKTPMVPLVGLIGLGVWIVRGHKDLVRFATGTALVLLALGLLNWRLFGAPWITGYDRAFVVIDEKVWLLSHSSLFTIPLLEGLGNQLFDSERGLLFTAPLWFAWPLGLAAAYRLRNGRERVWPFVLAAIVVVNVGLFAKYADWAASHVGNRFLFPSLAMAFALLGALFDLCLDRVFARWRGSDDPGGAENRATAGRG